LLSSRSAARAFSTVTFDEIPWAKLYVASEWLLRIAALILVPRRRTATAARGWLLLILFLPWPGVVLYLLIGRAYLPRRRLALQKQIQDTIRRVEPRALTGAEGAWGEAGGAKAPALELAARLSEFPPVAGNAFELLPDYDPALERIVDDIDRAQRFIHLLYYIFADDATGRRVADTLIRASRRGVVVRVLMDAIGSRGGLAHLGP
jgi:cardiolipin synthase